MIDLKAARAEPDVWRAALARKGAAEAFDELLAADERWRLLVPHVDELRSRTKLKGKPTPEQLEDLQGVKEELRAAEEELAAAEAARDEALALVPNPPHDSAPDGDTEDDAVEIRRVGEAPVLAEAKEASEIGRFELERAARLSGSRFGYIVGELPGLWLVMPWSCPRTRSCWRRRAFPHDQTPNSGGSNPGTRCAGVADGGVGRFGEHEHEAHRRPV